MDSFFFLGSKLEKYTLKIYTKINEQRTGKLEYM